MDRRKFEPGSLGGILFRGADNPAFSPDRLVRSLNLPPKAERGSATTSVLEHLDAAMAGWSSDRKTSMLYVVGSIATAERLRAGWTRKTADARYRSLAIEAINAAQLAKALAGLFSRPTDEIRALIGHLANFTSAALRESSLADHVIASGVARLVLKDFRSDESNSSVSNGLLADLVVLALERKPGGKGETFREDTIRRRYLKDPAKLPSTGASSAWKRNWGLVVEVSKLSSDMGVRSESARLAFEYSIHTFFHGRFSVPRRSRTLRHK